MRVKEHGDSGRAMHFRYFFRSKIVLILHAEILVVVNLAIIKSNQKSEILTISSE